MSVASGISSNNGGQERDRVVSSNSLALGSVILCIFQGERERERRGERGGKREKKNTGRGRREGGLDVSTHGAYMSQKKLRQMRYNNKHR